MPHITLTIDIDDETGEVSVSIDEVDANGITFRRLQTPDA